MLAALNLLPAERPADRGLAWITSAGCLGWVAPAVAFGMTLENIFEARVPYHRLDRAPE